MSRLFEKSTFNGVISKWDVSKVNNMAEMFKNSQFNGDISNWNVAKKTDKTDMFKKSLLEKERKLPKWYF